MPCIKCIICPLDAAAEAIDSTIYQLRHDPTLAIVPEGYVEKLEERRLKLLSEIEKIKRLNGYVAPEPGENPHNTAPPPASNL